MGVDDRCHGGVADDHHVRPRRKSGYVPIGTGSFAAQIPFQMKHFQILSIATAASLFLASCGVNQALVLNHNQNATQVHLGEANFRNVGKVMGTDSVTYVLIFGGMKKKHLYERAYAAMLDQAELGAGSRAVVNVTTEEHIGGVVPFYYKRTLTVSGQVVEFTR